MTQPDDHPPAAGDAPRAPAVTNEALAASSPDQNTILMRMVGLLTAEPARPVVGLRLLNTLFAGLVIILFVVAQWGVPALLAGQTLILQLNQSKTEQLVADRDVQRQQVTATREVLDAIGSIGGKLDAQSAKLDEQANRLDALAGDVADLQRGQAANSRGLARVQARQKQIDQRP